MEPSDGWKDEEEKRDMGRATLEHNEDIRKNGTVEIRYGSSLN